MECGIFGGCTNTLLIPGHKCSVCGVKVHNLCTQNFPDFVPLNFNCRGPRCGNPGMLLLLLSYLLLFYSLKCLGLGVCGRRCDG